MLTTVKKALRYFTSTGWLELAIWICGLLYLAVIDPHDGGHFALCPLKNLGFAFCPGCGLGASVSYLLHCEVSQSFHTHPLGAFALIVLLHRIVTLIKLLTIINHQPAKG
ncbi:MAG: DUF2752 domain-containing protein [Ignavibacteriae bacterium]|nr:DUF2752 domain-containing protein [Ignavibacteriota bacterium]